MNTENTAQTMEPAKTTEEVLAQSPVQEAESAPKAEALKPKKKKKKWLRRLIIILIVLLILAGAGYFVYSSLKQEYSVKYDSYTVSIGTISNSLSFSGSLQAIDSATYSAEAAGTVRNLYVAAGDTVTKGTKLLRLSNGQTVEAEFDGTVNQLPFEKGDEVKAGDTLAQVVDFTHMKVSIRIDEYDISDVHVGTACRVTVTSTEKTYDSVISTINYMSSSGGNVAYYTGVCYVDVDSGCYPGMQVTITVPQEEATDVVILKEDALSFDKSNNAYVLMKKEDGTMEEVSVTTGVSNGNYTEITSGLKEGDVVYAVSESTSESSSLLSGLFGGTNIVGGGGGNMPGSGGDMPDFSSGNMPDFSSGERPSFSGSGMGGGN